MALSGSPGEKYSVSQLLKLAFGILRTVSNASNKKSSGFEQSLSQLENSAQEVLNEKNKSPNSQKNKSLDEIEYTQIIEQINAIDKDWSQGDVFK